MILFTNLRKSHSIPSNKITIRHFHTTQITHDQSPLSLLSNFLLPRSVEKIETGFPHISRWCPPLPCPLNDLTPNLSNFWAIDKEVWHSSYLSFVAAAHQLHLGAYSSLCKILLHHKTVSDQSPRHHLSFKYGACQLHSPSNMLRLSS